MKVPLLDLSAQYQTIRGEIEAAVTEVLESQRFINGPAVAALEEEVAAYCGCAAAVGVSSGSDALLASLMALGVGPGDEVIVPAYTFFATAGAVSRVGATPVFADIEPDTFNLDPAAVAAAVTPRTRAVLPVHLYGQMADLEAIGRTAARHGLHVVEDACQAIGAARGGRKAGSAGAAGCFSFFPSKNLGGIGDGGMIVTQDRALADRLRILRDHGQDPRYYYRTVGGNFRLDTLQAAALRVKLRRLDAWSAKRRDNAARYGALFAGCDAVTVPPVGPGCTHVYNQYVVRVPRRDALQAHLAAREIGTAIYYPLGLHEQECFRALGRRRGDFPETERAAAEVLALPVYPELSDAQIVFVADTVKGFYAQGA